MRGKVVVALIAVAMLSVACGSGQKVGNEGLLDFQEQKGAEALGREPDVTQKPLTVGAKTPTPRPVQTQAAPKATPIYFDVTLITNSPYYKQGSCFRIPIGVTLRVTNEDRIPERSKGRSFTGPPGTFHSGLLKPGQSWTWVFDSPGSFEVTDEGLKFATADLHVGQGSCA